jgi:hypothetical protein
MNAKGHTCCAAEYDVRANGEPACEASEPSIPGNHRFSLSTGRNYRAYENGDVNAAWVDVCIGNAQDTELDGNPVPKGRFTLIGVVSQFHATDPRGGYQIIPINASDIIPAPMDPEPSGRMVTFKVDLGAAQSRGKFKPMGHKVWVRGSFNGWEMTDLMRIEKPGDVIHILTRFVEGGLGDTI